MKVAVGPQRSEELLERLHAAGAADVGVWEGRRPDGPSGPMPDVLLLDGPVPAALAAARRAHAADASVQIGLVVDPEHRAEAERALLFTPGLGELWIVSFDELGRELLDRAAEVTAQRRRYRSLRRRVEGDLARIAPLQRERALVSDRYLASLLQALSVPVLSVDAHRRIIFWNPATESVLERRGDQLAGRTLEEALRPVSHEDWELAVRRAEGGEDGVEIRFRRGGGEEAIGELTIRGVEVREHDVRVVVVNDITEARLARAELEAQAQELEAQTAQLQEQAAEMEHLNESLQERSRELEEALASRSRFYAAMSHELRTPMNAIIGYNALLLDQVYGALPAKQAEALERSQRAAQHLLELVNDVLDLSKIEAGRLELEPTESSFPELLEDLADTVRPMAEERGSELRLDWAAGARHTLWTDPRRVRQVLLNLLSNAIKFGEGQPVRLGWTALDDGGVRIDIQDRGPGISHEDQGRIFEEFVQIGGKTGTGLGLPISKRLAEALGGRLELESAPGRGSTFSLVLPRSVAPTQT